MIVPAAISHSFVFGGFAEGDFGFPFGDRAELQSRPHDEDLADFVLMFLNQGFFFVVEERTASQANQMIEFLSTWIRNGSVAFLLLERPLAFDGVRT
jgi:hypothetical protein